MGSAMRRTLAVAALAAVPALTVVAAQPAAAATSASAATAHHALGAHATAFTGYDMVGSDGGVFVFPVGQSGGFYGSLPGLNDKVNNIIGMVGSASGKGYYLVGSDGGVFAFGDVSFAGSLPGLGDKVNNIVGIVSTGTGKGYYLVGSDGGVFAFGDAPFLQSLPGLGIHVSNVRSIITKADLSGYWLIAGDGMIYNFGTAAPYPQLTCPAGADCSSITGGAVTSTGNGLWITDNYADVFTFGDAPFLGGFNSVPISGSPSDIVSLVAPSPNDDGYFLFGADGGVFNYGTAKYAGSLPALGVHVTNVVGAVPTVSGS